MLAELVKIFDRPAIRAATGGVFGRIYEYFLNKFAMNSAQEGGEFFTPPSLVRMIVGVIEPDHGLVLDPACGSAGMFVQTGHFIEGVRHKITNDSVTFHGQEKSDSNAKLARMNLVVYGLDASNIRQGNTFYDPIAHLVGQCDFVMANPPFNVDGVDTKKVEGQVGEGGRLPFGLPGTNGKTGAISNANSLWIQYFYSHLNDTGRAGFVMASSASDAGNKDRDIREKLVRTGHVDVMVAIGTKFFYTRKGEAEQDTVRDDTEALAEYAASLKAGREFLGDRGYDLDALITATGFDKQQKILQGVNLLCESDERRKIYQVIVEDVEARHRGLFPHPGLFAHDAEEGALVAICNKMQDARVAPDVSALLQDLYEVADVAVATESGVKYPSPRYDFSSIDFTRLRVEFEKPRSRTCWR